LDWSRQPSHARDAPARNGRRGSARRLPLRPTPPAQPRADTPGCTTQACGIRDHAADYDAAGAVVLGISPDPVKAVKKFADKFDLRFHLLADENHAVAEAYGVWVEKSRYGRTYWGNDRTTFVIDPDGRVAEVLRKVKPAQHDELVLAALDG
jgi:peroxiredoxin Q/BCP